MNFLDKSNIITELDRMLIEEEKHPLTPVFDKAIEVAESIAYKETSNSEQNKAVRYNNGKLRWSLVDFDSLEDMVKVLEFGAEKYKANNWKKGLSITEICESLQRHLYSFMNNEDNDLESNLSHIGHIMCNAMFISYMMKYKKEFDDRIIDNNKICCGNWNELGECKCK